MQVTVMENFRLEVEVAYNQFYLMDAEAQPEAPTDWSETDTRNRAKVAPCILALCPAKDFGTISLSVEVRSAVPDLALTALEPWQHAALSSIDIPSGQGAFEECEGPLHHTFAVSPGTYRVLFLCAGLDTLSEDGWEGNDTYQVVIWPARLCPVEVLKCWAS